MEKKKLSIYKRILSISTCIIFIALSVFFFIELIITSNLTDKNSKLYEDDSRSFHVIVTGTYENQTFMQQVYEGASKLADRYAAVVELYVPSSQAENIPIQELLNYCSYVNADGVIAYIDSPDEIASIPQRAEKYEIPLVTTGQFSSDVQQISYIGNSYWELGKKIAQETTNLIGEDGNVYVISEEMVSSVNNNNLLTSMQISLRNYKNIETELISDVTPDFKLSENENLFVCLSEDSTIRIVQLLQELFPEKDYKIIGFGSNEACQLYLEKGLVNELISLDSKKIGEAAITELFEYRGNGYANSYIAADLLISRSTK